MSSAQPSEPVAPPPANEQTPIIVNGNGRPSSYRATEAQEQQQQQPQASGSSRATRSEDASNSRKRRKDARVPASDDGQNGGNRGPPSEGEENWFRRVIDKYGAVELDNKGSTARDHLALERTFLAWLRTSLSFAGIGIAVTQLFRLNTTITDKNGQEPAPDAPANQLRRVGKPLGATFLAVSVIVLLLGWRRYFESQFYIVKGKFPASRGSIFLATFAALALIIATFVIVMVVDPSLFQVK